MPKRELNGDEINIIRKVLKRGHAVETITSSSSGEKLAVEFRKRGRITAAILYSMDTEATSVGVATFNPLDVANGVPYSDALGERVAFCKAIHRHRCL